MKSSWRASWSRRLAEDALKIGDGVPTLVIPFREGTIHQRAPSAATAQFFRLSL
jgi:hypothetical protein